MVTLQDLLAMPTEGQFFVLLCTALKDYHVENTKCSTELAQHTQPCPHLEFTLYAVLGHPYNGNIGYTRDKLSVFRLYAHGLLSWEAYHFEQIEPGVYGSPHQTITTRLEAIKHALQPANKRPLQSSPQQPGLPTLQFETYSI